MVERDEIRGERRVSVESGRGGGGEEGGGEEEDGHEVREKETSPHLYPLSKRVLQGMRREPGLTFPI